MVSAGCTAVLAWMNVATEHPLLYVLLWQQRPAFLDSASQL